MTGRERSPGEGCVKCGQQPSYDYLCSNHWLIEQGRENEVTGREQTSAMTCALDGCDGITCARAALGNTPLTCVNTAGQGREHDVAADELCAVLDGFDAVKAQPGERLIVTRAQIERWSRQVGRALLVVDATAREKMRPDGASPTTAPSVSGREAAPDPDACTATDVAGCAVHGWGAAVGREPTPCAFYWTIRNHPRFDECSDEWCAVHDAWKREEVPRDVCEAVTPPARQTTTPPSASCT